MLELILDPPFWAWIALAGVLLIGELSTGSFVLLWPAAAAGLTGLATRAPFTPQGPGEWLLFAVLTLVLAMAARALGIRRGTQPEDDRVFNDADSRVGQTALALTTFEGIGGRVRLADTDWQARSAGGTPIAEGSKLKVVGTDGTILIVEPLA